MSITIRNPELLEIFQREGVCVIPRVLSADAIAEIVTLCEPLLEQTDNRGVGVRRVLLRSPRLAKELDAVELLKKLTPFLGSNAQIIRAILFNKTPSANWLVPWHQDRTIAVRERKEMPGYGPWAVKDGEHHCQPPLDVLESIITVRLHLDPCPADAGPMRVLAGTHRLGVLDPSSIDLLSQSRQVIEVTPDAGDVVVTTPLAVHSSPKATRLAGHRRVLHLDYSSFSLPDGLCWAEN